MKIISSVELEAERFSDLLIGEVFKGVDGHYYIKIGLSYSGECNVFNLTTDEKSKFKEDSVVYPVYAELHVTKIQRGVLDE